MFSFHPILQRAADAGSGDGFGHRHVLPLPADQSHEELPAAAGDVSTVALWGVRFGDIK